ncbi:MAG: class I SAM-dependent methyltransferase [Verrucomicrobiota bacterium]
MVDVGKITDGLSRSAEDIWVAGQKSSVSYPDNGNESVFQLEDDSFWFLHRNRVIEYFVSQYSQGQPIFDIGGGNGCVSRWLQDKGMETVLLEPGLEGVRNARSRGVTHIIHSTFEAAQFRPEVIPAAGMFDVLEHVEKDGEFLTMLYSKMRPFGRLYLTVPAFDFLWSAEDDHAGHFRRYTLSQLRRTLESVGFKVEFESYLFCFLVLPIWIFRSLPSRYGWRKDVRQARTLKEHKSGRGFSSMLVNSLQGWELKKVQMGQKIKLGSSCFVVAKRV